MVSLVAEGKSSLASLFLFLRHGSHVQARYTNNVNVVRHSAGFLLTTSLPKGDSWVFLLR